MVITIIGILIALLLPAVQTAREAARQLQCKNNLKQIGLGCLSHEHIQKFLPTGGWGNGWAGEPARGFDQRQPGGWLYNILPFIEQQALHDLGLQKGASAAAARQMMTRRVATPIAAYCCPTRRRATAYPYVLGGTGSQYVNLSPQPTMMGRSDYAASGGDTGYDCTCGWFGPGALDEGDGMNETAWNNSVGTSATGIFFIRSKTKIIDIVDGASNTYLAGEKYCNPFHYTDGTSGYDDQGWDVGWDWDVVRWSNNDPNFQPIEDQQGCDHGLAFGSAHSSGFQMVLCDGSVHLMSYSIDPTIHFCLGNRGDGHPMDGKSF